jgi:D-alanine-D-alanine ligase
MSNDTIILFGGTSSERLVSVASAQHLAAVLRDARLWFWSARDAVHEVTHDALAAHQRPFELAFQPATRAAHESLAAALDGAKKTDVFVLALHGGSGEDGTVQAMLEERRLAFTGSSARASRRAFDKAEAKRLVKAAGGRVADAVLVSGQDATGAEKALKRLVERNGRIVVKPVADGSSAGLSFVGDDAGIATVVASLRAAPKVTYLAESFVHGTELTVGVYDGPTGTRALPASEVRMERGRTFDYEGKYLGKGSQEITPAEVSPEIHRAAGELATKAHRALGCLGYTRTDMIVDERGPVFLEINNLPGVTRASFIPQQLVAAAITMKDFLARQIELARGRYDGPSAARIKRANGRGKQKPVGGKGRRTKGKRRIASAKRKPARGKRAAAR